MTPPATSPAAPVDTSAEAVARQAAVEIALAHNLGRWEATEASRIWVPSEEAVVAIAALVKDRAEARATIAQFEKLMAEIAEAVGKTTWFGDLAQLVKATLFEARESGRLAGRAEAAEIARAMPPNVDSRGNWSIASGAEIAGAILSASTTPDPPAEEESDRG